MLAMKVARWISMANVFPKVRVSRAQQHILLPGRSDKVKKNAEDIHQKICLTSIENMHNTTRRRVDNLAMLMFMIFLITSLPSVLAGLPALATAAQNSKAEVRIDCSGTTSQVTPQGRHR